MNLLASLPKAAEPVRLTDRSTGPHRLQVVPLSDKVVAAFFDTAGDVPRPTAHLAAHTGNDVLCLPLLTSQLARLDGGSRCLFLLRNSARGICRDGLRITRDGTVIAEIDPMALQSPLVDTLSLLVGLAPEGGLRLLRLLLTTGLSLFGDSALDEFRDITSQLFERLTPPTLRLRDWCPVGRSATIASFSLPQGYPIGDLRELIVVGPKSARRMNKVEADIEHIDGERLLHLFLPERLPTGSFLVALSDPPLRLAGPAEDQRQRPLGPWLNGRTARFRKQTRKRLEKIAARDRTVGALLSEVACPESALPKVTPPTLIRTPTGILYAIGVNDPRKLLRGLVLRLADGDVGLPPGRAVYHPRLGPVQVGFVKVASDSEAGDGAELFLLYHSGRLSRFGAAELDPLPATIPDSLRDLPPDSVAPALAEAFCDALPVQPDPGVETICVAPPPGRAVVTVIAELGTSPDYPYALAAALGGRQDVLLILHHPDRRALPKMRSLGADLHAIYGLGVEIADLSSEELVPSNRMRALLSCVQTGASIFLSEDSLPAGKGWLRDWVAQLDQSEPAVLNAALQRHDGTSYDTAEIRAGRFPQGCFGLNAAARAVLLSMPLRVPNRAADIALLVATLRDQPLAHVAPNPGLRATAFAPGPDLSEAVSAAESRIIAMEPRP